MNSLTATRRQFLYGSAAVALCGVPALTRAADSVEAPLKGKLRKSLKIGMIQVQGTLTDKFRAAKEAGFEGVELNAPGFDVAEVKKAIDETGLIVDGSVCASHWQVRHTDPSPEVRKQALETFKQALEQTKEVGGDSVLLVVGHGNDGTFEECWKRSIDNISQTVELAEKLKVAIVIENVWNHFLYDHEGDSNQTADLFVKYVDEFKSPWVGMQFDIGNHWKYGNTGEWIESLGKRILKLDVKGFSRAQNKFTKIGEGDLDWLGVRKGLLKIGYQGWVAAEVGGGGPDRLLEISQNMDRVFGLA